MRFGLIGEGASDLALASPLERLLAEIGLPEIEVTPIDLARVPGPVGYRVEDKIRWVVTNEPDLDVLCIHRDADGAGWMARRCEIQKAAVAANWTEPVVPVIPVRAIEAWLLTDLEAIKRAADNPNFPGPLTLPTLGSVERLANPKERLYGLIRTASGYRGRRLEKLNKSMARRRTMLIRELRVDGSVNRLDSWRRFRECLGAIPEDTSTQRGGEADG